MSTKTYSDLLEETSKTYSMADSLRKAGPWTTNASSVTPIDSITSNTIDMDKDNKNKVSAEDSRLPILNYKAIDNISHIRGPNISVAIELHVDSITIVVNDTKIPLITGDKDVLKHIYEERHEELKNLVEATCILKSALAATIDGLKANKHKIAIHSANAHMIQEAHS